MYDKIIRQIKQTLINMSRVSLFYILDQSIIVVGDI